MLSRIGFAIAILAVVIPALVWGGHWGAVALVAVFQLVAADEWRRMAFVETGARGTAAMALAGSPVFLAIALGAPAWLPMAVMGGAMFALLFGLLAVPDTDRGMQVATRMCTGLLYVVLFFSIVIWIRDFDQGVRFIGLLLLIVFGGDTGAYFAGRAFGRTKLFPRISPKKTWEGLIGGYVLSVALSMGFKGLFLPDLPWQHAIGLALVCNTAGVLGDLVESLFKRAFGVKDSGSLLGEHGGVLDRVDSLLLGAPVMWMWMTGFGLG